MTCRWQDELPTLRGNGVTLRELRQSDALSLFSLLTDDQVARFISPPPTSPEGFERFIAWTMTARAEGRYVCFGVVPDPFEEPVGLFQIRQHDGSFLVAEWGFIVAHAFWGTGVFPEAARLVLEFAFDTLGVHRLEARAAVPNRRGQGALSKLGAIHEVRLRGSFRRGGVRYDQVMWTILADEWREGQRQRRTPGPRVSGARSNRSTDATPPS